MSAVYRALLSEADHYLEEAQGHLGGPSKNPQMAAAHAALAQALYARAALEKPDPSGQLLAMIAAKAAAESKQPAPAAAPAQGDPVVQSMNRHPAGKKRAPRKAAPRSAT